VEYVDFRTREFVTYIVVSSTNPNIFHEEKNKEILELSKIENAPIQASFGARSAIAISGIV
jgi:hypothetical protein